MKALRCRVIEDAVDRLKLINPTDHDYEVMKRCVECSKSFDRIKNWNRYLGAAPPTAIQKIEGRQTFCHACKVALCVGCAAAAGREKGTLGFICPICEANVPEVIEWSVADDMDLELLKEKDKKTSGAGGCFVATACFGDVHHPTVKRFREYRDQFLLERSWGKIFVCCYYRLSPPVADWLAVRPRVRRCVRNVLEKIAVCLPVK